MTRFTQCEICRRVIIEETPKEMGWTKIKGGIKCEYVCPWCLESKPLIIPITKSIERGIEKNDEEENE